MIRLKNMIYLPVMFSMGFYLTCATGGGSSSKNDVQSSSAKDSSSDEKSAPATSGSRKLLLESLSNNPMTSATINHNKARATANDYAGAKTPAQLEAALSAQRLARSNSGVLINTARKLVLEEAEKGSSREISASAKLELALGALVAKDYALAIHFLNEISDEKNPRIKAAVLNTFGVIDLLLDRVPEAVDFWRKALAADRSYTPAAYNLGFLATKYGDTKTGRSLLVSHNEDWFADAGIFVADRNAGGKSLDSRCSKLMEAKSNHTMIIYNCGVYEFQNKKNYKEAKQLISKAKGLKGESGWDAQANRLLAEIESTERNAAQAAAAAKAKSAAPKKAEPAKASPAPKEEPKK